MGPTGPSGGPIGPTGPSGPSLVWNVTSVKTSTYNANQNDFVLVTTATGSFPVNMPSAALAGNGGRVYIKHTSINSNHVDVIAAGSDVLEANDQLVPSFNFGCVSLLNGVCFISDGVSKWWQSAVSP